MLLREYRETSALDIGLPARLVFLPFINCLLLGFVRMKTAHAGEINGEESSQRAPLFSLWMVITFLSKAKTRNSDVKLF